MIGNTVLPAPNALLAGVAAIAILTPAKSFALLLAISRGRGSDADGFDDVHERNRLNARLSQMRSNGVETSLSLESE